jgi:hypothetical protein
LVTVIVVDGLLAIVQVSEAFAVRARLAFVHELLVWP